MTKQEFETFLEAKAIEAKTPNAIDWDARKQEWLDALQRFYDEVEIWLTDYLRSAKIGMERRDVTLEEENLGAYRAESRVLTIGANRVVLRPIGAQLVGARGRVDMEGPKGTVKFILTGKHSNGIRISVSVVPPEGSAAASAREPQPESSEEWVWKIATPPPKVRFIELTPEAFFDALMEIVNG